MCVYRLKGDLPVGGGGGGGAKVKVVSGKSTQGGPFPHVSTPLANQRYIPIRKLQ